MATGFWCVAGVDEAGRGPLAGPGVAAAVILDPHRPIDGLDDSKKLSAPRRERLAGMIRERALAWSVACCEVEEIDQLNILQATLEAMRRSVQGLERIPDEVLIDGDRCPALDLPMRAVIGGDAEIPCISAASILAKVHRDAIMTAMDARFPGYGFAIHKGYPTAQHIEALMRLGPSKIHRRSFAPVRKATGRFVNL